VLSFSINKDNWPIRRVFESRDHHNPKWTFTGQDYQSTKISPILQAWFLYSVNTYKYDIWNGYSSIFWHYFRSRNYQLINICRLFHSKSSLQSGTMLFSNLWWRICVGVLNYNTFSTTNISKTAENHDTENGLKITAYLASKWQQPDRASVLDYSLVWRQNPHVRSSWLPICPGHLSDNYCKIT